MMLGDNERLCLYVKDHCNPFKFLKLSGTLYVNSTVRDYNEYSGDITNTAGDVHYIEITFSTVGDVR